MAAARARARLDNSLSGRSRRAAPDRALPRVDPSAAEQIVEIQRTRLLGAAVLTIDELGYARTTVAHITRRARVSRRTFYELFADREQCLIALFDGAVEEVRRELAVALEDCNWRARMRGGLRTILAFLDRNPALARVCVVEALRAGPAALERRERALASLARAVDEGRTQRPHGGERSALTAEGLVGAVFAIVHGRLLRGEREPLSSLLGELMGTIVLPYLGPAAARREQLDALAPTPAATVEPQAAHVATDELAQIPMRVTYRTARMLACVAEHPGASNRALGDCAEIHDQGQVSKLLARLRHLGLLENRVNGGRGERNCWDLTALGLELTQRLKLDDHDRPAVVGGAQ